MIRMIHTQAARITPTVAYHRVLVDHMAGDQIRLEDRQSAQHDGLAMGEGPGGKDILNLAFFSSLRSAYACAAGPATAAMRKPCDLKNCSRSRAYCATGWISTIFGPAPTTGTCGRCNHLKLLSCKRSFAGPPAPCSPLGIARKRVAYCETAVNPNTDYSRATMFHPRVPFRTLLPVLVLVLLLAGCIMPSRQDATPVPPPVAEPVPESTPEDLAAVVNQDANVRTGPGTDHPIAFWLTAGAEVTVVGRNANGNWLLIEHEDRPGWIFATLIDIAAEGMAELPAEAAVPAPEPTPEPAVVVEPTPEPAPTTATQPTVTVTGKVVNLRTGPGTDHPTDGQVHASDRLQVTGRNADGSWLQVAAPGNPERRLWIYGPLTNIEAAATLTLTEVEAPPPAEATTPEAEPEPTVEPSAEPTREPAPEPQAAPPRATPAPVADCTQWHTVNANETRLDQITDWYELDLALIEAINQHSNAEPLEVGRQICLKTSSINPAIDSQQPSAAPNPQVAVPVALAPAGCPTCTPLPDNPAYSYPNVPIGQKVVDSPLGVLWHAPGSYSRDLPGLDYDFELAILDHSVEWDMTVRDFEACYDAVRVHIGAVARDMGLQKIDFQLKDSDRAGQRGWLPGAHYSTYYQSPWTNQRGMPFKEWPNWNPTHPDVAVVGLYCKHEPHAHVLCEIFVDWGNSHSIHLNAAATLALANSIAVASDEARVYRYSGVSPHMFEYNAYLYPLLDNNRGDPAGQGPCLNLARAT